MKAPAIFTLGCLFIMAFAFMWAVHPKKPKPVSQTTVNSHITKISTGTYQEKMIVLTAAQKARVTEHVKGWAPHPAYEADFNALDPSYKVAALSNSLFDPSDDYWGLPRDDKGVYELVDAYCTACHSASIVMQQSATPERWKELLVWMEEKQGMAKMPAEDEALVLEYISTWFSTN